MSSVLSLPNSSVSSRAAALSRTLKSVLKVVTSCSLSAPDSFPQKKQRSSVMEIGVEDDLVRFELGPGLSLQVSVSAASIPWPSSMLSIRIVFGSAPRSLNCCRFSAIVLYPDFWVLPCSSCKAGHWRDSSVFVWHRTQCSQHRRTGRKCSTGLVGSTSLNNFGGIMMHFELHPLCDSSEKNKKKAVLVDEDN